YSVPESAVNVQFMVSGSKKYAATGEQGPAKRPQRAERHDDLRRFNHLRLWTLRRSRRGQQRQQQGGRLRLRAVRPATRQPAASPGYIRWQTRPSGTEG